MSDFLGHLAARAIAQPSLRPRTRSRFEPAEAEEPALNWPATTKDEAAPAPAVVQRRAIDRPALPAAPLPATRTEPHAVSNESVAQAPPRGADVSSALPPDSAADAAHERTGRPLPTPAPTIVREVEQQTEYVTEPVTEVVERQVRVPIATALPVRPEARPQHRFDREAPRIIKAAPALTVPEPSLQPGAPAGLPAPHRSGSSKRGTPSVPPPAPEPVIEVSIGRIEVRAVQPAAGSRGSARPAAMSIDDYVAKRKAKERR